MTQRSLEVELPGGEHGSLTLLEGERIVMHLPSAKAPGQPLELTFRHADRALSVRAKTAGSRRTQEGVFEVRARLVSLRREARETLNAWLSEPASDQ